MNGSKPTSKTMRAVQWEGINREVRVTDLPRPKIQAPEDAIVRITSTTICGSELHVYHGILGQSGEPFGLGHEAVGIVEEVGDAVDYFKVGDRVIVIAISEDGRLRDKPTIMPLLDGTRQGFGLGPEFGGHDGLQATHARVPWADSSLVKIPNKFDDKEWLPLCDAWPTAWTGLTWSGFEPGDDVAIFGAGAVGLLAAYSAIIRGASLVYVIDYVPQRLAKAAAIGAVPINFARGGSASEQILRLNPAGVKRTVDAVGTECLNAELKPQQGFVFQEAIKITRGGGGLGIIGVYAPETPANPAPGWEHVNPFVQLPIGQLMFKEMQIKSGIVEYKTSIPALVSLVLNGRARPGFIFSAEADLEDAPRAYRRFERREEVRILLKPEQDGDRARALGMVGVPPVA
ncbi:hypothetical protein C8A03DRAFT_37701 [Achaetomium macrosporum]|uniref:Alcohol dehydrogenase-like N-terminal domain-containing protein n=1 Tax=Achaetomium macrosporum TaxID=79813 RepID=A0AAN7H4I1_9PEZI|nr:hypothetical protein C8A03DRAFT_37701 [Achaetomium macrosporum]